LAILPLTPNKNPQLRQYQLTSGQTPVDGEGVVLVSGKVSVVGADPTTMLGFATAVEPASLTFDPYNGEVLVHVAYPGSTFWIKGTSNPVVTNVGVSYGITAVTGVAQLDITETTTLVFVVEDIDTTWNMFEVSVLPAVAQLQGG